ncbi:MAG: hypothetical protein LBQ30_00735 [Treponema sp.]|nr:hypothetical protein [Treponema sp.]
MADSDQDKTQRTISGGAEDLVSPHFSLFLYLAVGCIDLLLAAGTPDRHIVCPWMAV